MPAVSVMRGTITTTLLNLRVTPEERGTIQRAVDLTQQTLSELMRAAALEYAQKVLERTT